MILNRTDIARGFVSRLDKVGTAEAVHELAALILEHRMHGQIEEILVDISKEYSQVHSVVEAEARTAFPLSGSIKEMLVDRVKKATKAQTVILHEEIDKSLLGGVVLSAPDVELDLSLQTKLAKLKV